MGKNKDKDQKRRNDHDQNDSSEAKRRKPTRGRSSSPKRRLPQQTERRSFSSHSANVSLINENRDEFKGEEVIVERGSNQTFSKNNNASILTQENAMYSPNLNQKARRNLIQELDAIDAEFEMP